MSIFSCAGWSEAGDPWVTDDMAMKRLVWSETDVTGGNGGTIKLARPPSNEGSVRDSGAGGGAGHLYRDLPLLHTARQSKAHLCPRCTSMSLILNGRGERIRTSDPLVPNQVRYQTALRPEIGMLSGMLTAGMQSATRRTAR
jgi:hypothetical protein